jgi:hypothetical protein
MEGGLQDEGSPDATMGEGRDASEDALDAAREAQAEQDAGPCGWRDDAGRGHPGSCAPGSHCCRGGAVYYFYCYSGEGSFCPLVP